jgi:hypothetical protein
MSSIETLIKKQQIEAEKQLKESQRKLNENSQNKKRYTQ